jgi:hypothetical protein
VLALAQTVMRAGGLCVFPALLGTSHAERGWSKATVAGTFTAALRVAAAASPLAGRPVDRGDGRALRPRLGAGVALGPSVVAVARRFRGLRAGRTTDRIGTPRLTSG